MPNASVVQWINKKYFSLSGVLNERSRRLWAATEARSLGHGGIAAVVAATGMSSATVHKGLRELDAGDAADVGSAGDVGDAADVGDAGDEILVANRIREKGGGRKRAHEKQPGLIVALNSLVEPATRSDPESPLRWTCKSTYKLADALRRRGFAVSPRTVARELKEQNFRLQANRKTRGGNSPPDRDAQFHYINDQVRRFQRSGQPVVSVDTKKKELVGQYKNAGGEWLPQGQPIDVLSHDFPGPKVKKAIPYGVYDVTHNEGWASVGIDHDTARFATATIWRWWKKMGKQRYPNAKKLLITADCGGSNSSRTRLWKVALQALSNKLGLRLEVCHFPPGTSKWNKIEHRMFCHITQNRRGQPLVSYAAIVELIGGTTRTNHGLRIRAEVDTNEYPTNEVVPQAQLARVRLRPAAFHGEWNYAILPN